MRPDAVVASASDGRDLEFPFGDGEATIDLGLFAGQVPTWTLRLRHGTRWLDWPPTRVAGHLAPWGSTGARALLTFDGATAGRPIITTLADRGQLAVMPASVRSTRAGLRVAATSLVGPHGDASAHLVMRDRASGARLSLAIPRGASTARGPWRATPWSLVVPWESLAQGQSWDLFIEAAFAHATVTRRLTVAPRWRPPRARQFSLDGTMHVIEPRATYKARALSVRVEHLSLATWRELHGGGARRQGSEGANRELWLIGELPDRARDNGLALFRYVTRHHPEIDARYVITADSPDRAAVEELGPLVLHGTPEHARAVLRADRIAATHHPDYLYPLRTAWMRRRVRATLVFMQHGVLGAKWVADIYGANSASFETDLFLVSSPREREIVERDFGYSRDRVAVTGLPRFDSLVAPEPRRDIVLVVPTWRPWIDSPDELAGSEFASQWRNLLADARVREVWQGLDVVVTAHPNMGFAELGDAHGVRLAGREESIQSLVRRAAMVVTDFSSVGIDAALLDRPVVYFAFDGNRLQGRTGAHSAQLPGDVTVTLEAAVAAIEGAAARNFEVGPERAALARTYFPAADAESSRRVFEAVRDAVRTRPRPLARRLTRARRALGMRVARSRLRTPLVRVAYELGRLTPLTSQRVLLETSFGKQYGDSPRAIYEELRRARPDLACTWVGVRAQGADSVGRLTLRYGWLLGTAGTLISNQSLPHWIRTRRHQLYIQTWHGTPLKRMLHDLDHITGRDAGYVARATRGAAQWGVMLSPNPHTTAAMASAFRHRARVVESGYPRNDAFYAADAHERAARVRTRLGIAPERAIVLHAPTFRDEGLDGHGTFVPTEIIDLERFAERYGATATLVLRRHVLDRTAARIPPSAAHCVVDASGADDTQDLLIATDVLVTDYSSVAFDFLNTRRPSIFFAPDIESYRDRVRGFYLDEATDLPGPLVRETAQFEAALDEALARGSIAGYDMARFARRYCPHDDGRAAARVVAELFGQG